MYILPANIQNRIAGHELDNVVTSNMHSNNIVTAQVGVDGAVGETTYFGKNSMHKLINMTTKDIFKNIQTISNF